LEYLLVSVGKPKTVCPFAAFLRTMTFVNWHSMRWGVASADEVPDRGMSGAAVIFDEIVIRGSVKLAGSWISVGDGRGRGDNERDGTCHSAWRDADPVKSRRLIPRRIPSTTLANKI
jgi:hypothetical protein